jgi:hypothetical protein
MGEVGTTRHSYEPQDRKSKKPAKAARKTAVIQKMTTRVAGEIITEG